MAPQSLFCNTSGADLPFHEYHSVADIFPVRSTLDHMTRSKTCNPPASQLSASSSLDPAGETGELKKLKSELTWVYFRTYFTSINADQNSGIDLKYLSMPINSGQCRISKTLVKAVNTLQVAAALHSQNI